MTGLEALLSNMWASGGVTPTRSMRIHTEADILTRSGVSGSLQIATTLPPSSTVMLATHSKPSPHEFVILQIQQNINCLTWVVPSQEVLGEPDLELRFYAAVVVVHAVQVAHYATIGGAVGGRVVALRQVAC